MESGEDRLVFIGGLKEDNDLPDGAKVCLHVLQRVAKPLADIVAATTTTTTTTDPNATQIPCPIATTPDVVTGGSTTTTTSTTTAPTTDHANANTTTAASAKASGILNFILHGDQAISMILFPVWTRAIGASGGAAIFLTLFSYFMGVRVKPGWVAIGVVGLSGYIYEVSQVRRREEDWRGGKEGRVREGWLRFL